MHRSLVSIDPTAFTFPDHEFFIPTPQGLDWLVTALGDRAPLFEAGCGTGKLTHTLREHGIHVVAAIDIIRRDNAAYDIVHMDALKFPFPERSWILVARPNRGWVDRLVEHATACGCAGIFYIGKPEHVGADLGPRAEQSAWECGAPEAGLGEEGESAWELVLNRPSKELRKFYLIENSMNMRGWYEINSRGWYTNSGGGGFPISNKEKVLETVMASSFDELDYSKTTLLLPDSPCGWLSPEGKWYPCHRQDHDAVAHLLLKSSVASLERAGWARMDGLTDRDDIRCQRRLTADQRNWLSLKGIALSEED